MKRSDAEVQFTEQLKAATVPEAALEARLYLKAVGVGDTLTPEQIQKFSDYCARRGRGEPAAYILGHKGFYKWDFWVQPGVLIPRPETEHIIEVALKLVSPPAKNFADLGCGSGIIGISLAKEWNIPVTCVDTSPIAVEITQRNAHALGASHLVSVVKSPVESFLPRQTFDLVVANPPYIATGDPDVEANVHKYEPSEALYAGPRGTEKIHEWSRWALKFLTNGGWWIFEFGAGQRPSIEVILLEVGFVNVQFTSDLAGIERVCACQKP